MLPVLPATFAGAQIFGDAESFSAPEITFNVASMVDTFLGLTPGTTQFGASSGGRVWTCSGVMIDDSSAGITAQQNALMAYAEFSAPFGRPANLSWPQNWVSYQGSRFRQAEVTFGPIISYAGNRYSATFKLIIRSVSNS